MTAMKSRPTNPSPDDSQSRLAVLIDADNAQPSVIEGLLAEVAKFGVASVKRIYGDFSDPAEPVEEGPAQAFDQPGAAVRLHQRQERHRRLAHY